MILNTVKVLKIIFVAIVLMLGSANVYALDLDEAKNQGLVGERPDGYLGAVKGASGVVQVLIDSINTQRKVKYQEIANKNGTNLQAVQSVAGQTAIDKTKPGHFIFQGGSWKMK